MPPRHAQTQADTPRLIGDVARMGVVESVDLTSARVTVAIGDLITGALPWQTGRAGGVKVWAPPSVGEQVLVICPEGDVAAGVVIPGFFSDDSPAPDDADLVHIAFGDGATIIYDPATANLDVRLVNGGKLRLVGDLEVTGKITATDDVLAAGISLKGHRHPGVQVGPGLTQIPQVSPA